MATPQYDPEAPIQQLATDGPSDTPTFDPSKPIQQLTTNDGGQIVRDQTGAPQDVTHPEIKAPTFGETYTHAAINSYPGMAVQWAMRQMEAGMPSTFMPGADPEVRHQAYVDALNKVVKEGNDHFEQQSKVAGDPGWGSWLAQKGKELLGGALADPEVFLVGPEALGAKGMAGRAATMGAVGSADDVTRQGLQGAMGQRDSFDPTEALMSGLGAAGLHMAIGEPLHFLSEKWKASRLADSGVPAPEPKQGYSPKDVEEIKAAYRSGQSFADVVKHNPRVAADPSLEGWFKYRDTGGRDDLLFSGDVDPRTAVVPAKGEAANDNPVHSAPEASNDNVQGPPEARTAGLHVESEPNDFLEGTAHSFHVRGEDGTVTSHGQFEPETGQTTHVDAATGDTLPVSDDLRKDLHEQTGATSEKPAPVDESRANVADHGFKSLQEAEDHVNDITKDWKNRPNIDIHSTVDDIPDYEMRQQIRGMDGENSTLGWTDANNDVHIVLNNHDSPAHVTSTIYHEALGHAGLTARFGASLDHVLNGMYDSNLKFRAAVDDWIQKNPDAYADSSNQVARAADEVLAETSENGPIQASFRQKASRVVRQFGRKVLGHANYSDNEIKAILAEAHNATIHGKNGTGVADVGVRLARKYYHSTPHDFDQFDHSRMGTGEGNQAYGYGTYAAENPKVAETYRNMFERKNGVRQQDRYGYPILKDGSSLGDWLTKNEKNSSLSQHDLSLIHEMATRDEVSDIPFLHETLRHLDAHDEFMRQARKANIEGNKPLQAKFEEKAKTATQKAEFVQKIVKIIRNDLEPLKSSVKTLEVHVPDDAKFLDFDEHLTSQKPEVKELLNKLNVKQHAPEEYEALHQRELDLVDQLYKEYAHIDHVNKETGNSGWFHESEKTSGIHDEIAKTTEAINSKLPPHATGQDLYNHLAEKHGGIKGASDALREAGLYGHEYLDGFSRNGTDNTKNAVFYGDKENGPTIVNRFARKRPPSDITDAGKKRVGDVPYTGYGSRHAPLMAGNINLERIKAPRGRDIASHLSDMAEEILQKNPSLSKAQTFAETQKLAVGMGMSTKQLKAFNDTFDPAFVLAARKELVTRANQVEILASKMGTGLETPEVRQDFKVSMRRLAEFQEEVMRMAKLSGQNLSSFRIIATSKGGAAIRLATTALDDPASLDQAAKLIQEAGKTNPNAAMKVARDMTKPRFQDYAFSTWYNMILSNPYTHAHYYAGNALHFAAENISYGMAAIAGQSKRFSSNDRVLGREVLARIAGSIMGIQTGIKQAAQTFMTNQPKDLIGGATGDVMNPSGVLGQLPGLAGTAGKIVETPSRILSTVEEFFNGIIKTSDYYGHAVRMAQREGLMRPHEMYQRVRELVDNPNREMIKAMTSKQAKDYLEKTNSVGRKEYADQKQLIDHSEAFTRRLQYRDQPSALGQMLNYGRQRKLNYKPGEAQAGIVLKAIMPFVGRPDGVLRSAIRFSPLGVTDRYFQSGVKAGGAERDIALSRIALGSGLALYAISKAAQGYLSGEGPSDYKARAQLQATGWRPNSIKIGDAWHSYHGFSPLSESISGAVTMYENHKEYQHKPEQDYADKAAHYAAAMAGVVANSTALKDVTPLFQAMDQTRNSPGDNALKNWTVQQLSSMVVPAGVRAYNNHQGSVDARDVSGTGHVGSRVEQHILNGWGANQGLPLKYDVYGRPQQTNDAVLPVSQVDKDPVPNEVQRLSNLAERTLVPPVTKADLKKHLGYDPDSNQLESYQNLAGRYIHEDIKQTMASDAWKKMTDAERVGEVLDIGKERRKQAREELFPKFDPNAPITPVQ